MKFIIKTMEGLEEVLKAELEELNLQNIKILKRGVECEGNWIQLYKCNYHLRTAIRVLVPIKTFEIETQDDFYEAVKSIDWSLYIAEGQTFAVRSTVFGEIFTNSLFVTYRCKDAIVDQLSEVKNYRPDVDLDNPDIVLNIHLHMNQLSVALDSSGKSLHLRNYKQRGYKAPLNEAFAAGIIKLSGWDKEKTFYDPMCGSGTFTTEALMMAGNIPAGYLIERFSFENWPEFYPDMWKTVKEVAKARMNPPEVDIISSDIHRYAVRDLRKNLEMLPFRKKVTIKEEDFLYSKGDSNGIVFMNPPYDKRVKVNNVTQFYRLISDHLKQNWSGSSVWVLSGNPSAMKNFGLKHSQKITLDNGGLPSKLYNFELYEGSKKSKYQRDDYQAPKRYDKDTSDKPSGGRYEPSDRPKYRFDSEARERPESTEKSESRGRYESRDRSESKDRYASRDKSESKGSYESKNRGDSRDRYQSKDRSESKDNYASRNRDETRDRNKSRDDRSKRSERPERVYRPDRSRDRDIDRDKNRDRDRDRDRDREKDSERTYKKAPKERTEQKARKYDPRKLKLNTDKPAAEKAKAPEINTSEKAKIPEVKTAEKAKVPEVKTEKIVSDSADKQLEKKTTDHIDKKPIPKQDKPKNIDKDRPRMYRPR